MTLAEVCHWQLRGAVLLAVAGVVLPWALRRWRIESPRGRFLAVVVVFLAALCPWSWRVEVPWYEAEMSATAGQTSAVRDSMSFEESLSSLGFSPVLSEERLKGLPAMARPELAERMVERPAAEAASAWDWQWLGMSLWLGSVLGALVLAAAQYVRVVVGCRPLRDDEGTLAAEWQELQRVWAVGRRLPLVATRRVGPLLGRLPRGFALLVPQPLWGELTAAERQVIMKHELAHYLRGDVWASALLRLLAWPFAYHPLAWRLVGLFDEAAEWACDQRAVQEGGRVEFARALTRVLAANIPETSLALGRCAQSHPLVLRVRRVLNPQSAEESRMRTMMMAGICLVAAAGSLIQVRLTAQDQAEATIERVKSQIADLAQRLTTVKERADAAKEATRQLEMRVQERLETLKTLGQDPAQWTADARARLESLKSGDEARQLQALDGVDKLGDEGLVLCAAALQLVDRESVRRRALSVVCAAGDAGLPVLVRGFPSLAAAERLFTVRELARHKEKVDVLVFARLARDESAEIRSVALEAGLTKGDPLVFLALAGEKNSDNAQSIFDAVEKLAADERQLILYAAAKSGGEEILPETVRRAAKLGPAGYPVIATVYQRKTPASRAEIVRVFRKSTVDVEKLAVALALRDEDATLREAAEKAQQEP